MIKLQIQGREDDLLAQSSAGVADCVQVTPRGAVRVELARGAGDQVTLDAREDDVVEIELEDGIRLLTSVAQLQADLAAAPTRGPAAPDGTLIVPPALAIGAPTRGFASLALKTLKLVGVDLAQQSALGIARLLENQLDPEPGLYFWKSLEQLEGQIQAAQDLAGLPSDQPLLIFLHGTFSTTQGSFGGLSPARFGELMRAYPGRILALQHRSASESPIRNALDLAQRLPTGARLHLVSHSRGGLIGELLCRGQIAGRDPMDSLEMGLFAQDPAFAAELSALRDLNDVLRQKRPRVERFVRVACPARGTSLASGRLDRYLSILLNLIGWSTGLASSQTYRFVKTLLLAVAKERTRPETMPGLAAQMPSSPLVRLLNRPGVTAEADLSVIAGDLEGGGILGRLKTLATDLLFLQDHDLVVDTLAMYGGTSRRDARYVFDQGPKVDHFSYFKNDRTASQVVKGLLRSDADAAGFNPLTATGLGLEPPAQRSAPAPANTLPVVFLLPGIMGSHLSVGGERIWMDLSDLAKGKLAQLDVQAVVRADAVIERTYGELSEFLSRSHEVIPFPFDWRLPLSLAAKFLADAIERKLAETQHPIRLLAHSLGGLLARVWIADYPHLWKKICEREGGRLIQLGTPNRGSYVIPRVLLGHEKVVRQLAFLDFQHPLPEVLAIVARFPGLIELLPQDGQIDLLTSGGWHQLAAVEPGSWTAPQDADLTAARALHDKLNQQVAAQALDPRRVLYVAGQAKATPVDLAIRTEKGQQKLEFLTTAEGDGRVPWRTGLLPGIPTWYLPAEHGKLTAHPPAFLALQELLQHGHTDRLPQKPPAVVTRGAAVTVALPADTVELFPDAETFAAAALGYEPQLASTSQLPIELTVAHGNLAFARYPVMVGHYEDDVIVSAEAALDRRLDGRLSQRHRLGIYPGPIRTAEVVLAAEQKPGGAIVVGLGKVGDLTPGKLIDTIAHGALRYALAQAENTARSAGSSPEALGLSALLIGSGEAGLHLADCLRAFIEGVINANRLLADLPQGAGLRIAQVELIELYQDRAISALRTLGHLAADSRLTAEGGQPAFELKERRLQTLPGNRRRVSFEEEQGWWRRLQITRTKSGRLEFNYLSDRARSERLPHPVNHVLVDQLLERAIRRPEPEVQLLGTLFELLVPNEIKKYAPDRRDLVLVLDESTAKYPWELLVDPFASREDAVALRAGLIRQLQTETYRQQAISAGEDVAFVLGDTCCPAPWPELKGAQAEAQRIAERLSQGGFRTTPLIRPQSDEVLTQLLPHGYRILHLAGHGVYRYQDPRYPGQKVSGLVLGEGMYLQPADIEQMRQVPELVFLNCCHLGRIDNLQDAFASRHKLAANLAAQFIRMGVRAVVAAGWAVHDGAALTFAETFYSALLAGDPFGAAVHQARTKTHADFPRYNTWGAYQCYGDPAWVLVAATGRRSSQGRSAVFPFVALSELQAELENLASQAKTAEGERNLGLIRQVERLQAELPPAWQDDAPLLAGFGRAHAELGNYGPAVAAYRQALGAPRNSPAIIDVEQLASVEMHWAMLHHRGVVEGNREDPAELLQQAIKRLTLLNDLGGATVERRCLLGAAYKRLALVSDKPRAELKTAAACYQQAYEQHQQLHGGEVYAYPLHNWLLCLFLSGQDQPAEFVHLLATTREFAERRDRQEPSFWHMIIATESDLVGHLVRSDLKAAQPKILDGYFKAWRRGASQREIGSIVENLRLISELLNKVPEKNRRRVETAAAVREIHELLQARIDGGGAQ